MYFLNVSSQNYVVYFSSEQLELLTIIQCSSYNELISFIKGCEQLNGVFFKNDLDNLFFYEMDDAKRKVFKAYQDTLVVHDSESNVILDNLLSRLNLRQDEIDTIKNIYQKNSKESLDYVREFIKNIYPNNYEQIFRMVHRIISVERDQNKDQNLYDEFVLINNQLDNFNTLLVGSGKPEVIINELFNNNSDEMFDFYFSERDLNFALKNNKHVRFHSLLTKSACEDLFDGKSKKEVIQILSSYVKHTIDFVNRYNKTRRLADGSSVINAVDLFNEIVSFDKNAKGEYENIWETKYGISIQELCDVFKYAQDNKPEGISYLYNEPFLEDPDRRKKVIETLKEINASSNGLIDTLGYQMHITFSTTDKQIEDCFSDLYKLQVETGIKIQITEFDLSLSEIDTLKTIGDNPQYSYEEIYKEKEKRINSISSIINNSGVKLSGISYWSLSDKVDFNLERIRTNLLNKGLIGSVYEVPTVCGGLYRSFY